MICLMVFYRVVAVCRGGGEGCWGDRVAQWGGSSACNNWRARDGCWMLLDAAGGGERATEETMAVGSSDAGNCWWSTAEWRLASADWPSIRLVFCVADRHWASMMNSRKFARPRPLLLQLRAECGRWWTIYHCCYQSRPLFDLFKISFCFFVLLAVLLLRVDFLLWIQFFFEFFFNFLNLIFWNFLEIWIFWNFVEFLSFLNLDF